MMETSLRIEMGIKKDVNLLRAEHNGLDLVCVSLNISRFDFKERFKREIGLFVKLNVSEFSFIPFSRKIPILYLSY